MIAEDANRVPETTNESSTAGECNKRNKREFALSRRQHQAISLLLCGQNDADVARAIGVHRSTLGRWRIYHPTFRTELNRRREALYLNTADRLRSLASAALDILQKHLTSDSERAAFRAAVSILRLTRRLSPPIGPTDEYDLLNQLWHEHELKVDQCGRIGLEFPKPKEKMDNFREFLVKKARNIAIQPYSNPNHPQT